jgi:putative ABC transport system permease protein
MLLDIRHGLNSLLRAPSFTIASLLTLALGIAATAAIFSVSYAILLKPLPYPESHRLFVLGSEGRSLLTGEIFHYVRNRARTFEHVATHARVAGWNLVSSGRAEHVNGMRVSQRYFDVLGVPPAVGRAFSAAEDTSQGPPSVVLSHPLARRLFGDQSNALGQRIQLGGQPYTVIGVMPASYWQTPMVDLWTPLQVSARDNTWNYALIGRLRRDATEAQMVAELEGIRPDMLREVRGLTAAGVAGFQWAPYRDSIGLGNREQLVLLSGAVAFLLLIACVNVASLQLVRAVGRRREMATRAALGGGRARLVRQVAVESALLALGGAILGLAGALWGLQALLSQVPEGMLAGHVVTLDWPVAVGVLAIAVGVGILFGLAPAFSVFRLDVRTALAETGRYNSSGRQTMRVRRVFTAAQVAMAVVLLAGAGLLIQSFVNLRSVPLGFDPDRIIVGQMSYGSAAEVPGGSGAFFQRALADLRKVPGVAAAAVANNIPVETGLNLPIRPPAGGVITSVRSVDWRWVSSEYFDVFRIPLRDGRAFDDRDHAQGAPVAVVNEAFARLVFGRPHVVGEVIQVAVNDAPRQIVGVVADVKGASGAGWTTGMNALAAPAPPVMYVPVTQLSDQAITAYRFFPMSWTIRTTTDTDVTRAVREVVQSAAPQLPFVRFETMNDVIARDIEMQRFLMVLVGVFAFVAMALAGIGIYGLMAYSVMQRTQEVGIRMALGATRGVVLRSFVSEGLIVAVAGLAAGLVGAYFTTQILAAMIYGVTPDDPLTLAGVSVVLIAITALATLLPALKASDTNPAIAMRAD